jgi:hypothetical protein
LIAAAFSRLQNGQTQSALRSGYPGHSAQPLYLKTEPIFKLEMRKTPAIVRRTGTGKQPGQ